MEAKTNQNHLVYIIWHRLPCKTFGKSMVLQHLGAKINQSIWFYNMWHRRSCKTYENQWFYNIWEQRQIKTIGFKTSGIENLVKHMKKLVLQHLEAKTNQNNWFYNIWPRKPCKTY